jgi:hypothetical protein
MGSVRHPTTLGPIGKLFVTAAVVVLGLGVRAFTAAWADFAGPVALALTAVAIGVWGILASLVLWFTWRPARRLEVVHVEGEVLSATPARRRADDVRTPVRRG